MKRLPYLLRYLMVLGIALGISFGAHIGVRDQSDLQPIGDLLPVSYSFNFVMAYGIVFGAASDETADRLLIYWGQPS
jgi:hypothetical protein